MPNQDEGDSRDFKLPNRCKDLIDLLNKHLYQKAAQRPEFPIIRSISLPTEIDPKYLLRLIEQQVEASRIIGVPSMLDLSISRTVPFRNAAKLLRLYGIEAIPQNNEDEGPVG